MDKMYKKAAKILEDVAGKLEFIVENEDKTIDITHWKAKILDENIKGLIKARSLMAIAERKEKKGLRS